VGKAPLILGWQEAHPNEDAVRRWFSERRASANVGVVLAQSGLLVVDPDSPAALAEAQELGLPPTPTRHSRNQAFIYRRPEGCPTVNVIRGGRSGALDVLASGQLVLFGRHVSGVAVCLTDGELADAPDWAVAMLRAAAVKHEAQAVTLPDSLPTPPEVPTLRVSERMRQLILDGHGDGYESRSEALFAAEVALVREGYDDATIAAVVLAHPIGEKAHEQGREWLAGDIARARATTQADPPDRPDSVSLDESAGTLHPEAQPANAPTPSGAVKRPTIWTCANLLAAKFPEPTWVVPDLLPAGFALLAGRPKMGKSWLALQLAEAVATGGLFLGRSIEKGRVLFIAREDSPRRLQGRLRELGAQGVDGLDLTFSWPSLATPEGLQQLEATLGEYRLVVVDTLARAVSGPGMDWDSVSSVTAMLGPIQQAALSADASLLAIDHLKKPSIREADPVDDVMGSTGKTAVADVVLGLFRKRGEQSAKLTASGRDIEESEIAIAFDRATCRWHLSGAVVEGVQMEIVTTLKTGPMTVTNLAKDLNKDHSNISRELGELVAKGLVKKPAQRQGGVYSLIP
jgi:hypothetical protein